MQYGYFDDENREYVITRPDTPAPWANYLGSPEYGALISNNAGGYSFVKPMTLDAEEFIRRFLLHVLPDGFRKIRHYGLFAARDKGKRLSLCRLLTKMPQPKQISSVIERLRTIFGADFNLCPCCGIGYFSRDAPCTSA